MKSISIVLVGTLTCVLASGVRAQMDPDTLARWNEMTKNIPVAKYDYPANRPNRNNPPGQGFAPPAYLYAYSILPYAIDLGGSSDFPEVIVDFDSVDMSSEDEARVLKKALYQLQQLAVNQSNRLQIAQSSPNMDNSGVSGAFAIGAATREMREFSATRNLIGVLANRLREL